MAAGKYSNQPISCVVAITDGKKFTDSKMDFMTELVDFTANHPTTESMKEHTDTKYFPKYYDSAWISQCKEHYPNITLTSTPSTSEGEAELFDVYDLQVAFNEDPSKTSEIPLVHIFNWTDFEAVELGDLEKICKQIEIFNGRAGLESLPTIHCTAGVGRTGVIGIALCLRDPKDQNSLESLLREARKARPETVQSEAQFLVLAELANKHQKNWLCQVKRNPSPR
ncbi:protein-tyrosine phosphatase family protein [Glaciimonas immobilis]|uniref:Protein tyrosine phosphatase n=1 Tax=Glaciimonas immobilis TaxID=728004 RepID=A0A840RUH8_9BURK|nr:protein-tyrosine phosphatase family protein [Glaciimonas immobilis]KAF3999854.1 hypothetical protein HAV38_01305 [Glaciimonas immobilis]MBB5200334.1 protein tyrosine phosphatase [Glaciimonas immobilis]